MNAIDFFKEEDPGNNDDYSKEIDNWLYDKNDMVLFAERYHQAKLKLLGISNVVKSLPTDECVEQWWAEGQDQKEGFWQEAPYRTNGDVIEEIKTALKYFIKTWQR